MEWVACWPPKHATGLAFWKPNIARIEVISQELETKAKRKW